MIDALLPKVRRKSLALLFGRPGEALYLREIVRAAGGGKGAIAALEAGRSLREQLTARLTQDHPDLTQT